jgi:drug/metabolite transporter, DME family
VPRPQTTVEGSSARRAALAVLLAATLAGTVGVAQALGRANASTFAVGAARTLVGALALLVIAGCSQGGLSAVRSCFARPTLGAVIAAGGAIALYQVFYFTAVVRTGVGLGSVVTIGTVPIFTALVARASLGERLTGRWLVSTAGAVLGCVLIVLPGKDIRVDLAGFALALAAAAAEGVSLVALKRLIARRPPLAALSAMLVVSAVLLSPLVFTALPQLLHPRPVAAVLWLGLVTMALGYRLFIRGLEDLSAATVATLGLAEPLAAVILGLLVLDERFTPSVGAGMILVFAALVFLAVPGRPEAHSAAVEANEQ